MGLCLRLCTDFGFYLSLSLSSAPSLTFPHAVSRPLYSLNDFSPSPALAFALSSSVRSAARSAAPLIYNVDRENSPSKSELHAFTSEARKRSTLLRQYRSDRNI